MRSVFRFVAFAATVVLALTIFYFARRDGIKSASSRSVSNFPMLTALDGEVTALVDHTVPSVVSISARMENPAVEFMRNIRLALGLDDPSKPELGSGIIASAEGHIVTNWHVIEGKNRVNVQLSDGRAFAARFLDADPQVDIAVLKIEASGLTPMKFADSDSVKVGQVVFAIGNPLGLSETVTQGIISGKSRRVVSGLGTEFFQTDVAINPGNSGGPLINVRGEAVGINSAILLDPAKEGLPSNGISFAIPSNVAMRVFDDVVKRGRISRPWFGAITYALSPQVATRLGVGTSEGNLVVSVAPNSPVARAGIRVGDVIQEFNGNAVRDSGDIANRLSQMKEGDRVNVTIWRNGARLGIPVTVETRPWQ